ncbi:Integral membrane protein OS=Streptomyces aurantiogriseus OX=66870 GN=GCM10010251_77550 PE=4 SV=1 [Streptomyces aurantiogriseus]
MSAETPAAPGQFTRRRLQFRAWRGARPFWAGLFVLLGGFPIMYFPYAHLQIGHLTLAMATTAGAGSLIIGVLLVVLGVSLWFQKHVRVFAGVAAILLGLVSLPVSNFGGFIIGFLFALIGGAMAVSWAPGVPPRAAAGAGGRPGRGRCPRGDPSPWVVPRRAERVENPYSTGPAFTKDADGADVPNDLSGTSPANGANGRHSAG